MLVRVDGGGDGGQINLWHWSEGSKICNRRNFLIPVNEPSIFLDVAEMMQTCRGPLKQCE